MKRLVIEEEKIIHNLEVIGEKSGGAPLIAVLKANAYGLGMLPMADLLRRQGVKMCIRDSNCFDHFGAAAFADIGDAFQNFSHGDCSPFSICL